MIALYYATVKARPGIRSTRSAHEPEASGFANGPRWTAAVQAATCVQAGGRAGGRAGRLHVSPKSAGDTRTTRSERDYAVDRFEEAAVSRRGAR
jgi:hypothetical protein